MFQDETNDQTIDDDYYTFLNVSKQVLKQFILFDLAIFIN